jgi:hypothetical protein
MPRIAFKTADPSRRIPVWLQNGTKENLVWQLKLTALYVAGTYAKGKYDDWQWKKKYGVTPRA